MRQNTFVLPVLRCSAAVRHTQPSQIVHASARSIDWLGIMASAGRSARSEQVWKAHEDRKINRLTDIFPQPLEGIDSLSENRKQGDERAEQQRPETAGAAQDRESAAIGRCRGVDPGAATVGRTVQRPPQRLNNRGVRYELGDQIIGGSDMSSVARNALTALGQEAGWKTSTYVGAVGDLSP